MELLAKMIVAAGLLTITGLLIFFCWKASQMMQAEAERARLRASTAAAMRYDRHMQKLKRQNMRVTYRRARVW